MGWRVTAEVVSHLLDGVEPGLLARAEQAALDVPGGDHVHARGRWTSRSLLLDIEGFVAPSMSVEASEDLGTSLESAVATAVPECRTVLWTAKSHYRAA